MDKNVFKFNHKGTSAMFKAWRKVGKNNHNNKIWYIPLPLDMVHQQYHVWFWYVSPLRWFCIEDRPHPHLHPLLQLTLHSKRNCSLGWLGEIDGVEVKKYKDPNEPCKYFLKTFILVYVNFLPKVKVQVKSKSLHSI